MWTLAEAVTRAGGTLHGDDRRFTAVSTDSRGDCTGQLFIALRGERFDGHDYVEAAARAGAVAAMVDHPLSLDLPQWVVADTRSGLGRLAHAWRARFPGRVVALTGSNGKTTTKEMIAAILAQVGQVRATRGNLNNDIGMPLTLLKAGREDFLVLEMGANHPGEIDYMTRIAEPEVALITNVGRAHLEGFGSIEGVAHAKGEIVRGLTPSGTFVVPGDSAYTDMWRASARPREVVTFALEGRADLVTDPARITSAWESEGFRTRFPVRHGDEEFMVALRLAGAHNVHNALAACAVARVLGIGVDAIRAGLETLQPIPGRLFPRECGAGALRVLDDTYNANPDSIAAAIDVLAGLSGRRWLVLGDLGELGTDASRLHEEVGNRARDAGIDRLVSVGSLSAAATRGFGEGARHFASREEAVNELLGSLQAGDQVLVKGSRLARMERIVEALCAEGGR